MKTNPEGQTKATWDWEELAMEENQEGQVGTENQESVIMSFYYDQESPSGVGFETIEVLSQCEDTLCLAMELATKISDSLPEEAKEIMVKEGVPLYRIYTDHKGLWGEWCDTETLDVDQAMNRLLDKIAEDFENAAH